MTQSGCGRCSVPPSQAFLHSYSVVIYAHDLCVLAIYTDPCIYGWLFLMIWRMHIGSLAAAGIVYLFISSSQACMHSLCRDLFTWLMCIGHIKSIHVHRWLFYMVYSHESFPLVIYTHSYVFTWLFHIIWPKHVGSQAAAGILNRFSTSITGMPAFICVVIYSSDSCVFAIYTDSYILITTFSYDITRAYR